MPVLPPLPPAPSDGHLVHSVHLNLQQTTFSANRNADVVVHNTGGRLRASGCAFVGNGAKAMMMVERGTLALMDMMFAVNTVRDGEGQLS